MSTSLGFCLTLLPLLSIGIPAFLGNGEDYFIRTVPKSELSTPEDYLKSMDEDMDIDLSSASPPTNGNSEEDDDVEKNEEKESEVEEPPANEETPLLSS